MQIMLCFHFMILSLKACLVVKEIMQCWNVLQRVFRKQIIGFALENIFREFLAIFSSNPIFPLKLIWKCSAIKDFLRMRSQLNIDYWNRNRHYLCIRSLSWCEFLLLHQFRRRIYKKFSRSIQSSPFSVQRRKAWEQWNHNREKYFNVVPSEHLWNKPDHVVAVKNLHPERPTTL